MMICDDCCHRLNFLDMEVSALFPSCLVCLFSEIFIHEVSQTDEVAWKRCYVTVAVTTLPGCFLYSNMLLELDK